MPALAQHTNEIFDKIASLECIKPYILVGGTALALQLHARLSEDLDFMRGQFMDSQYRGYWSNEVGNFASQKQFQGLLRHLFHIIARNKFEGSNRFVIEILRTCSIY